MFTRCEPTIITDSFFYIVPQAQHAQHCRKDEEIDSSHLCFASEQAWAVPDTDIGSWATYCYRQTIQQQDTSDEMMTNDLLKTPPSDGEDETCGKANVSAVTKVNKKVVK